VPKEGEILVRIHAMSVNSVDWKLRSGPRAKSASICRCPSFPAATYPGEVAAVGAAVTDFAVGQSVFAMIGLWGRLRGARRVQRLHGRTQTGKPSITYTPRRCRSQG